MIVRNKVSQGVRYAAENPCEFHVKRSRSLGFQGVLQLPICYGELLSAPEFLGA